MDFVVISKKRKLSELTVEKKRGELEYSQNTSLDMRINKIEINQDNHVTIKLVLKLDFYSKAYLDIHTLFLVMDVELVDSNRVFESDPTGDLCVGYMATLYKESGERLFTELLTQSKRVLGREFKENINISDKEAEDQSEIILQNYIKSKTV